MKMPLSARGGTWFRSFMRAICLVWMVVSLAITVFAGMALQKTQKTGAAFAAHEAYPAGWVEKVKETEDPVLLKRLLLESMASEQRQDVLIVNGNTMLTGLQCVILSLSLAHLFWGAWWLLRTRTRRPLAAPSSDVGRLEPAPAL